MRYRSSLQAFCLATVVLVAFVSPSWSQITNQADALAFSVFPSPTVVRHLKNVIVSFTLPKSDDEETEFRRLAAAYMRQAFVADPKLWLVEVHGRVSRLDVKSQPTTVHAFSVWVTRNDDWRDATPAKVRKYPFVWSPSTITAFEIVGPDK